MDLLRVGVAEKDEIFRRGLIASLRDEDWDCIVLATDGAANGEDASSATNLDIAVVCAKVLGQMRLPCPIVCLADPPLYGAESCHSSANVKAILPHEHLSADELVVSVRAAVAGLRVESPGLSRQGDAVLDARRIERITDVSFTSATITVSQDQDANGSFETVMLTVHCTFSPPTSHGSVPTSGFSCTTS